MHLTYYKPLYLLLLLLPLLWGFRRSLVNRPKWLRIFSFILRTLGIILIIIALCGPFVNQRSNKTHVVFLVDVSESVDLNKINGQISEIEKHIGELRSGDSYDVFCFADGVRKTSIEEMRSELEKWLKKINDDNYRKESEIAKSLLAARLFFPANKRKRLVLYSDGLETKGDASSAIATLRDDEIDIWFVPCAKLATPEVSISSLESNADTVYIGEKIRLKAKLLSNKDMIVKLRFINRGVVMKEKSVKLEKDLPKLVKEDFVAHKEAGGTWKVEVIAEKDHFSINNQLSKTIEVKGRARVLTIHSSPEKLNTFVRALKKQEIQVDVRGKFGLPESLAKMLEFDAIILADIPATELSPRQLIELKRYVSDYGGGLIMTGSENSFGLGGYYKTPVEEVLPLVSRYEKEKKQPSLAMVLIIDKSGSMQGQPVALAREAAKSALELLGTDDQAGVIAFDGEAYIVSKMTSLINFNEIQNAINGINAGGGTNMYPAMLAAKEMLDRADAPIKHVIILSDGQSTPGDFTGLAEEMANSGMTVSTVALGGADRSLMKRIAEIGRGRFYEAPNPESMPRIFAKETIEASRSAIKEMPFTPVKVADADWLEGIDFSNAPFLLGYVMTRAKPSSKTLLLTETGDPLLACGRFGLGRSAAFTSDISEQWAGEWLEWREFGKFWGQLLRYVIKSPEGTGIVCEISEKNGLTNLRVERRNELGEAVTNVDWSVKLFDQHGAERKLTIMESGYGVYETNFKVPDTDNYTIRLHDNGDNTIKTIHRQGHYSKEYALSDQKAPILSKMELEKHGSITENLAPVATSKSIKNILCILALACFLIGIALRRI